MERGVKNELRHYIVSGLIGETKKKKKRGHGQLKIATHLTNHAFIADKVHKNPIAHYTLY